MGFSVIKRNHYNPSMEEKLFGDTSDPFGKKNVKKKSNYTLLFMNYYIYTNKWNGILVQSYLLVL